MYSAKKILCTSWYGEACDSLHMTTLGQSSSTAAVIWGDFIAQCKLWLGHNCSDFSDPQELNGMEKREGKYVVLGRGRFKEISSSLARYGFTGVMQGQLVMSAGFNYTVTSVSPPKHVL